MTKFYRYILILLLPFALAAQSPDRNAGPDSTAVAKKGQLEGPIKYQAERIHLSDGGNRILLLDNARLEYLDMTLTADYVLINQRDKTLFAKGLPDSVDKQGQPVVRGTPVFTQKGQEPLYGDSLVYNFETQRGRVFMGKTKMEPGFYRGTKINRIADSTLLIKDGIFTSCEYIDHPHYYFQSKRIRMKMNDKVIAKPIVFYIADVPLMWLPFGIFPNKGRRHSGIVIPKYGESTVGGRFLRGMGYYWAPNDYFDATFLTDFYDKLGFAYRARARYTVRYKLNGSLSAEYYPRDPSSGRKTDRWRFTFAHRQKIDPTMNISGQGSFQSDKNFARQLSPNMEDRLNQNITSNLSFSKSWPGTKNSLSVSLSHNQNLQTGRISYTLPSIAFNRSSSNLFELLTGQKVGAQRKWYQSVYFSYNSRMLYRGDKVPDTDSTFVRSESKGVQHNFNFTSSQKVLKYVTVNPAMNFQEVWVDEINAARLDSSGKIVEYKKKQFAARHTFNASLRAKTTLYGLFEPNIGKLKYIRHKIDPSVSFTYRPDFSTPTYGYFTEVADTAGVIHKIDKFKKNPFGATGSRESRAMNFNLSNVFEGKLVDEDGKEKKISLLTVTSGASYNFLKDSLKWSNISSNVRTKILGKSVSFRMVHSLYQYVNKNGQYKQVNRFSSLPKLISVNTSIGFSLNDRMFKKKKKKTPRTQTIPQDSVLNEGILKNQTYRSPFRDYKEETKRISMPWSTSFNFSYSYNRFRKEPHRLDLSARANFQLTKNWKVSWSAHIDLIEKRITTQRFNVYRDLHCWEMSFGWQPTIGYYDFQINIKASALRDIKVTKHPTRSGRVFY